MLAADGLNTEHKVMPELRAKGRATLAGFAQRTAQARWAARTFSLLHKHAVKDSAEKVRRALGPQKAARQGARDMLRAMDHQLQAVGEGLATFRPTPGTASRPLQVGEERCEVPDKRPVPPGLPEGVVPKRICIKNVATGKLRYEVLDFSLERPLLSIWADEGPRDMPALWFLCGAGYRTLFFFDSLHRTSRDLCLAAKSADMWTCVLDTSICMNCDQNPFKSQGWWHLANGLLLVCHSHR